MEIKGKVYLTIKESSEKTGFSVKTIRKYVKNGQLPSIKRKNKKNLNTYYIENNQLEKWYQKYTGKVLRGISRKVSSEVSSNIDTIQGEKESSNKGKNTEKQEDTIYTGDIIQMYERIIKTLQDEINTLKEQLKIKDTQIKNNTHHIEYLTIQQTKLLSNGGGDTGNNTIDTEIIETPELSKQEYKKTKKLIKKLSNKKGIAEIKRYLEKRGIRTKKGKEKWDKKTIYRIITGKR